MELQFIYDNESKLSGVIVSGDTRLTFRKFPTWDVNPVETYRAAIESFIESPNCETNSGCTKFMGWEYRSNKIRKYLVKTDYGLHLMYSSSVKQLRESAGLKRSDKIIVAPKGW